MLGLLAGLLERLTVLFLKASGSGSFPEPLSEEEEKLCFKKMSSGDEKMRSKLILHNMRLVVHIVKKYYSAVKDQDDLISVGTVGLIKAIDSFKAEKGKFATYAGKCIQNEILMLFRSQKKLQAETSMHESIDVDKEGNPLTYMEILPYEDNILEVVERNITVNLMSRAIETVLDERERKIIKKRYGLPPEKKEMPQREVAKEMGISRSYVSRIEKTALQKMENYMRERGIDGL